MKTIYVIFEASRPDIILGWAENLIKANVYKHLLEMEFKHQTFVIEELSEGLIE